MATTELHSRAVQTHAESLLGRVGPMLARYGLVVVIGWIGALKFTSYEAHGIEPLVSHSPFMSWVYDVFSVTAFSSLLGVVELATAALLAVKPWHPKLSIAGSLMAIGLSSPPSASCSLHPASAKRAPAVSLFCRPRVSFW
jgi:uncharacterized membrane protein YkgB